MDPLRRALRAASRNRFSTLVAVAVLAIGIGAAAAMLCILDGVVLRPLPFPDPDRLVRVVATTPAGDAFPFSEPGFLDLAARQRSLSAVAAGASRTLTLLGGPEPERVTGFAATPGWFRVLGLAPEAGRLLTRGDEGSAVLVSAGFALRRLGGGPAVGRTLLLDGVRRTVVGVVPGAPWLGAPEVWLPLAPSAGADRTDHELTVIARLRPGISATAATRALAAVARGMGEEHPASDGGWGMRLVGFRPWLIGSATTRAMVLLAAAVALLLLLTCADLAALFLARSVGRAREFTVRAALGASRARLAGEVLAETLVLAVAGGALGTVLAAWLVPALRALAPAATPRIATVHLDAAAVAAASLLALGAGFLFGVLPALGAGRVDLAGALRAGGRTASGPGRALRLLAVAETSLAVLLLVGAGLLVTSYARLQAVDPGYAREHVLVAPLALTAPRYHDDGATLRSLVARVRAVPGVAAAGATNVAPFGEWNTTVDVAVEGRPSGPGQTTFARWRSITPGYFDAAGVRLARGRLLRSDDARPSAEPVVVVTRAFARAVFPGEDPIGRRIAMGVHGTNWRRIIGIVDDVRDRELTGAPVPLFFFPDDGDWPWVSLVVRSALPDTRIAAAVRAAIHEVDPDLPVPTLEPVAASLRRATAAPRFRAGLVATFAAAALLLAALGLFGVISYRARARTREIGIRIALGATAGQVRRLVLTDAGTIAVPGFMLGAAAAALLARPFRSLLFDTSATEPAVYLAAAAVTAATTLAAAALPARRAARIPPAAVLDDP